MQKANWKTNDLASTKITKKVNGEDITLDLIVKDLCSYCNRDKGGRTSCCGYNSWKKGLEIDISQTATARKNDLKMDLEKALFNESLSDFSFSLDKEKIPVSKIILSARSPVFDKFFNSDFMEKKENTYVLQTTIPTEAFKELIRYIYTGDVCDMYKHVFDLLQAADYYQVDGLKTMCEEELLSCLSEENANKIFQAAHLYQCRFGLKEASYAVIKKIFEDKSYTLSDEFLYNPSKIAKLFEKMESFEMELNA